jgi:hypothetical protein
MVRLDLMLAVSLAGALAVTGVYAQKPAASKAAEPTRGFNNPISEQILTPNTVQTRIGRLSFVDGVPTAETTRIRDPAPLWSARAVVR